MLFKSFSVTGSSRNNKAVIANLVDWKSADGLHCKFIILKKLRKDTFKNSEKINKNFR